MVFPSLAGGQRIIDTAAIDPAEDVLRGLEKYLRIPLKPETLAEVEALLERYKRRHSLVRTLARALFDTIGCDSARRQYRMIHRMGLSQMQRPFPPSPHWPLMTRFAPR